MKFSCEKSLLINAASSAGRAAIAKSPQPALEGILIEARDQLYLTGYNMEIGIRTQISADISQRGSIVLSAKILNDIIRSMPDDIITFQTEDNFVTNIKCGNSNFNIVGMDAANYPELPILDQKNSFFIEERLLKSLVGQTIFAVSDNEARPVYTGELFAIEGNTATAVALDGFRIALRREIVDNNAGESFSFIIPAAALKEADKIASDCDSKVEIRRGSKHAMFIFQNVTLITRLLEGEFLDYKNAIPRQNKKICLFDTAALKNTVDRIAVIIDDVTKYSARCTFEENVLKIKALTGIGEAYDQCAMQGDGEKLEIGFNVRYLQDALKAVHCEQIKLELGTNITPVVIVPAQGEENFLYMVLPVRLKTV